VTLGICMDLNPQAPAWTLEGGPYELADHCLRTDSRVLLLLNAWLDSRADPADEQDWQTLNYWAARLRPLWTARGTSEHEQSRAEHGEGADGTVVVVCNRSGEEDGQFGLCASQTRQRLISRQASCLLGPLRCSIWIHEQGNQS
jgi:protein N-terminal amidase